MGLDLSKAKDYMSKMNKKYSDGISTYSALKEHQKLSEGLGALDDMMELTNKVSTEVNRGHSVLSGMASLSRRRTGTSNEGDKKSLDDLSETYYGGEGIGIIKRAMKKALPGKRYPTMRESLKLIGDIAENIPEYVTRLSNELEGRRVELVDLRGDLREGVERLISSRMPLEEDIAYLDGEKKELQDRYDSLEGQRVKNSSEGASTDPQVIHDLGQLELILGEMTEKHSELAIRRGLMEEDIDLMNGQIEKVGELMDLLYKNQSTTHLAKKFVEVQIPYILKEIGTQETEVKALVGVGRVSEFLSRQSQASGEINKIIKDSAEYLGKRVEEVKCSVVERSSIYEGITDESNGRKVLTVSGSSSSRLRGYLTSGENDNKND